MQDMRKTKAQLAEELARLREGEARDAALALEHERVLRALRERVKELNCLYAISRLAQNRELPMEEVLRQVAELVCASWQFPESACARIRMSTPQGEHDIRTGNYRRTRGAACQKSPVSIQGERIGEIEVCYLDPRPPSDEGPFLREERNLLDAVADKLGRLAQTARTEAHMLVLSRELIKAQETERLRIATELHDHLAQDLATLKMDLGGLLDPPGPDAESLPRQLASLADRLSAAITAIRDLAYDLLPPGLEDLGLVRTMSRYCADFATRTGIAVDFYADGMDGLRLGFETQIHIYRMVQESLTNIRKHAHATQVTVRMVHSHPSVIVRVEDNGQGVDLEKRQEEFREARRMGLWGMRERARLLGGLMSLRSRPGRGMLVHIEIPVENRNNVGEIQDSHH
ncbi:Histidine kinase-, DNA gyrase B-, and HSP90-like ATPase [Humidesulfovibrio mexicanus]|uniref:Histidine kinase-, DNA gyrase B-, and HSP90-like ATPase n=1 Tax=Humidesulfovibrio mexicanus TaxID=147047 RepID=A0A238YXP0_9BACT|nr:sensor histidine kinase [Humidesulfovibrio mexicanus]SNR75404.1 Histidine kinase-, DNA gyrase B-, and HSP90-like ATPase [Humidesulfovibrio mexicanus]